MKVALITGGSRGIGAATAQKFAEQGYSVILNYNKSEQQAQSLKKRLTESGGDVHLFKADISDVNQIADMFAFVGKYFKHLDALVNNAGISCVKLIQDTSETDYDNVMGVNAKGAFFCCKYALPFLKKCNGSIVNVSSIWGVRGASCESVYSMSKHALIGLTKSLSEELCQSGVSVNALCPPIVLTDMSSNFSSSEIDGFCAETNTRVYTPSEVADRIFALVSSGETGKIIEL